MAGLDIANVPFDLIMNIINIVVLYVIVRALVYKPVRKFLNARKEQIKSERDDAARVSDEAQQLRSEFEAKLSEGEASAKALVKHGEDEAQKRADEIIAGAKQDAKKLLDDADRAASAKEAQAVEKMREDVVELSLGIASKVVGRSMTDEDNRRMAEEFFEKESENIN